MSERQRRVSKSQCVKSPSISKLEDIVNVSHIVSNSRKIKETNSRVHTAVSVVAAVALSLAWLVAGLGARLSFLAPPTNLRVLIESGWESQNHVTIPNLPQLFPRTTDTTV